ncbi:MAG: hypothetical protein BroJett026_12240 [Betaproteobacteria bacterium]|nr:MAG: hypothetical protein BroJett026_12240 [Betaproteobacteria bacterium]
MSGARRPVTASGSVPSPCVSVCVIDQRTGLCAGCLRTLDEIASWSVCDDDGKRAVLAAIAERRGRSAAGGDGRG